MFSLWCSGNDGILIACTPAEIGRDFPWCTATCAWPPLPTPMTSESPFLAVFIREKGEETVRVWHYFFLSSGLSFCLWSPHTHSHTHTYIHTHSGNDCRKSSCDVPRRAAATARKLVFQVTALGNFRKAGCTAADVVAYGCTHIHTHAGRWIGVQIVSDMLISSPSLTADASAIKVKARERQPSRLSSSSSSSFLISPAFFLSWSVPGCDCDQGDVSCNFLLTAPLPPVWFLPSSCTTWLPPSLVREAPHPKGQTICLDTKRKKADSCLCGVQTEKWQVMLDDLCSLFFRRLQLEKHN